MPFGGLLSAGIGAGSSILSGVFGGKAAKTAAKQQAAAQQQAADITGKAVTAGQGQVADATTAGQKQIADAGNTLQAAGDQTANLYSPFTGESTTSLQQLNDLAAPGGGLDNKFSFTGSDLANEPGYQESLKRGQDALQRSAAAQGGLFGTNTLKRLGDWTVGTANQNFNDAFNRAKSTFDENRSGVLARADTLKSLASLALSGTQGAATTRNQTSQLVNQDTLAGANLGYQGATTGADIGLRGATAIGSDLVGKGNAESAGTVGQTNSFLDALKQGSNGIQQFLAKRAAAPVTPSTVGNLPLSIPDYSLRTPSFA